MAGGAGLKQLRASFFDIAKVQSAAARLEAKAQSKFGAFVRRRMRSSIRYRKERSTPGSPPSAHKDKRFGGKSPLRELIFFARDPNTNSVVIGPLVFGPRGAKALEQGGTVTVKKKGKAPAAVTIAPRPFAKPAGDAEAAKFGDIIKGLVK